MRQQWLKSKGNEEATRMGEPPHPGTECGPCYGCAILPSVQAMRSMVEKGRKERRATLTMRFDMSKVSVPTGKRVIWRAWITVKGKRVYARERGIRAFPIIVDE